MTPAELQKVLELHKQWKADPNSGKRADPLYGPPMIGTSVEDYP